AGALGLRPDRGLEARPARRSPFERPEAVHFVRVHVRGPPRPVDLRGPRRCRGDRRVHPHAPTARLRVERGRARGRPPRTTDRASVEVAPPAPILPRWRFWPVLLSAVLAFLLANLAVLLAGRFFAIPIGRLDQLTPEQIAILTAAQDLTLALGLVVLLRAWPKLRSADLGVGAPLQVGIGVAAGAALWGLSIVIANAQAAIIGSHP